MFKGKSKTFIRFFILVSIFNVLNALLRIFNRQIESKFERQFLSFMKDTNPTILVFCVI